MGDPDYRAYHASVLVSPGTLVLRPDDFVHLQGGMVRREDPETGGSMLIVAPAAPGAKPTNPLRCPTHETR